MRRPLLLCLLAGCSLGPSLGINGSWILAVSNYVSDDGLITCAPASTTFGAMRLERHGDQVDGAVQRGTLTCDAPGGTFQIPGGISTIAAGSIAGDTLSLSMPPYQWHFIGLVREGSMSGLTDITLVQDSAIVLRGSWIASR